jgi:hypothetical protein
MKKKIEMKVRYFIKKKIEKVNTPSPRHTQTKPPKKLQNTSHTEMNEKMNKIAHHKLTLTHDGSIPKTV